MKKLIVAFFAGVVMASAGIAGAVAASRVRLHPGEAALFAGVGCVASIGPPRQMICVGNRHNVSVFYARGSVRVYKAHPSRVVWSG
jgi:hypothetical protein